MPGPGITDGERHAWETGHKAGYWAGVKAALLFVLGLGVLAVGALVLVFTMGVG